MQLFRYGPGKNFFEKEYKSGQMIARGRVRLHLLRLHDLSLLFFFYSARCSKYVCSEPLMCGANTVLVGGIRFLVRGVCMCLMSLNNVGFQYVLARRRGLVGSRARENTHRRSENSNKKRFVLRFSKMHRSPTYTLSASNVHLQPHEFALREL